MPTVVIIEIGLIMATVMKMAILGITVMTVNMEIMIRIVIVMRKVLVVILVYIPKRTQLEPGHSLVELASARANKITKFRCQMPEHLFPPNLPVQPPCLLVSSTARDLYHTVASQY